MHYSADSDPEAVFAQHVAWARAVETLATTRRKPLINSRAPRRRLRIGYVSPDFRHHSVAHFIRPVLMHHDHEQFEIICYAEVSRPDAVTAARNTVDLLREEMGRRGPCARLAEIPGVGHAPMLMDEAQIDLVRRFLFEA